MSESHYERIGVESDASKDEIRSAYRERIGKQWAGMEKLPGTYPFTLDRSVKAFRLNDFLHRLIIPEQRKRFLADPEPMFAEAGLTDDARLRGTAVTLAAAVRSGGVTTAMT